MHCYTFLCVLALAVICLAASSSIGDEAPSATLDSGVVVGTTTLLPSSTVTVNKFLGVPFASPPKRFEAPKPPEQWHQPLNTTKPKPSCIQAYIYPKEFHDFIEEIANNPAPPESEDCLYLDVFAPAGPAPPGGRTVMLFLYGGNFQSGSVGALDGSKFPAYEDVILVAPQYRTNIFGFPPLEIASSHQNLGFLDQRLALDWVQRNIQVFGGDKDKVMIFGQSSGAMSVDVHLTAYTNHPPFRAAIMESGQYSYLAPGLIPSEYYFEPLLQGLNCSFGNSTEDTLKAMACLKGAPADTVRAVVEQGELLFYPSVDNVTMIAHPIKARATGKFAKVPIIEGNVENEGTVTAFNERNLTQYLQHDFGSVPGMADAIQAAYPRRDGESDGHLVSRIHSDFYFACPQALHANATAAANVSTWRYYFNATAPPNTLPPKYPNLGTFHGLDVYLAFGLYLPFNVTPAEYALSNYIRRTWANFAKNPDLGPDWNEVGSAKKFVVQDGSSNPIAVTPAPLDLDLAVIGGRSGDVAGVEIIEQIQVNAQCEVFLPLYKALAEARGDEF